MTGMEQLDELRVNKDFEFEDIDDDGKATV